MEEKTNKAKFDIFKILRKSADICKVIAFNKISRNFAFYGNSINIHLLGIFACKIHICDENSAKSYGFHENVKIIENHFC